MTVTAIAASGLPDAAILLDGMGLAGTTIRRQGMEPSKACFWTMPVHALAAIHGFPMLSVKPAREFYSQVTTGELIGMSTDRIPMSKEGYEKRKALLDRMKHEDMPRIAEQIAQARGFGDLSENAEFDAAVEAQGMLQARINELQNELGRAFIVEKPTHPPAHVVFGSTVRVLDIEMEEEEVYMLVGPGEEDYDQNRILLSSPIGQSLLMKKIGDEVDVPIPRGFLKLRVLDITIE